MTISWAIRSTRFYSGCHRLRKPWLSSRKTLMKTNQMAKIIFLLSGRNCSMLSPPAKQRDKRRGVARQGVHQNPYCKSFALQVRADIGPSPSMLFNPFDVIKHCHLAANYCSIQSICTCRWPAENASWRFNFTLIGRSYSALQATLFVCEETKSKCHSSEPCPCNNWSRSIFSDIEWLLKVIQENFVLSWKDK